MSGFAPTICNHYINLETTHVKIKSFLYIYFFIKKVQYNIILKNNNFLIGLYIYSVYALKLFLFCAFFIIYIICLSSQKSTNHCFAYMFNMITCTWPLFYFSLI